MSIGTAPEYGVKFRRWGDMTEEDQQAWFAHMKTWGPHLLDGYATLIERTNETSN